MELTQLQPTAVFRYFSALCSVPHGSGNTEIISKLLVSFAKEHNLSYRQDAFGNVIIRKPASRGYESRSAIILQGHMDMVCVKPEGCKKDMAAEGIDVMTDGTYVWARDTSLGGDNGLGVAMILAVLDDDLLPHPPLEAVITVDEETNMVGAQGLDCSDLKGRLLLNLDSDEEGIFTVSCAGGVNIHATLPVEYFPLCGEISYRITLDRLTGGHSGSSIQEGRASGNCEMLRILHRFAAALSGLRLSALDGGKFHNTICSEAAAVVSFPAGQEEKFLSLCREYEAVLKNEFSVTDPHLTLTWEKASPSAALTAERTTSVLRGLFTMPNGVQVMSRHFPGLVQTSLNMGLLHLKKDCITAEFLARSSVKSQLTCLVEKITASASLAGGTVTIPGSYPPWPYLENSRLLPVVAEEWKALTGKDGRAAATHAGLECGIFCDKMPGLDVVSLGPDLENIHSVSERFSVASAARCYELLCAVLRRCP